MDADSESRTHVMQEAIEHFDRRERFRNDEYDLHVGGFHNRPDLIDMVVANRFFAYHK